MPPGPIRCSWCTYPDHGLDGAPFVHRSVGLGGLLEVGLVVEDHTGIDGPFEDVGHQLGDVEPRWCRSASPADVGEERRVERDRAVGDADDADDGTGSGGRRGGVDGLLGADVFERCIDADPAGQLEHGLFAFLPTPLRRCRSRED